MKHVALEDFMAPLAESLAPDGVSEVSINRPGEAWIETSGEMRREPIADLDRTHLRMLCGLIAQSTAQELSEERPLVSGTLPGGYRVQLVLPPAAEEICLSIRKPSRLQYDLAGFARMGGFDETTPSGEGRVDPVLAECYEARDYRAFLSAAIRGKKNILISGGTSTAKTSVLNACLREIAEHERIITVEDAREVQVRQPNRVHLISSRGGQGQAQVTPQQLIEASLRLRPDRIIMGELRGAEAFAFLRAVNTGHPGSIATLHADTSEMAFEQLTLMVTQADLGMTRAQIMDYVRHIIPIVVQLRRGEKGRRYVSEIYYREGTS
jgi:type IV secretion system protein VirB11